MRHGRNLLKLSRPAKQRNHLLKNLATHLCEHERITTTKAKATAVRKMADRLITIAKRPYLSETRRCQMLDARLNTQKAVDKVFNELAPRFEGVDGNYCYITPSGRRKGDAAKMAVIQFKYNPTELYEKDQMLDSYKTHLVDFNYKLLIQERNLFQGKLDALASDLMDPVRADDKDIKAQEKFYKAQLAIVEQELSHFAVLG